MLGDSEAEATGFDPEFNATVLMPLYRPLYRKWFRVRMHGLENVPASGAALVVANHSACPARRAPVQTGLFDEHRAHRNLRVLSADLVYEIPLLSDLARRSGRGIRADRDDAGAAGRGRLVGVFPEGFKGIGKPFRERYHLQRFGRGGFASTAIDAGACPSSRARSSAPRRMLTIGNSTNLARLLNLPYFPVTPLFPWLGPLGAVPLRPTG